MEIHSIDAGYFLCDGGGIFGGVPKVLWSRQVKADELNLIKLAMRCLLVVNDDRKVLIETGAGEKLSWKFVSCYHHGRKTTIFIGSCSKQYHPVFYTRCAI